VSDASATSQNPAFDPVAMRQEVTKLGPTLTTELLAQSQRLYAPYQEAEPYDGLLVSRDVAYGSQERQRLDAFRAEVADAPQPALVFVHGGGFVGGDKHRPGSPFYDNIAVWAARNGLVGINMTYRLAPDHPWPAGAQDVGAVVRWIHENAAEFGIDPAAIVLMGQSAGATHVATYVANKDVQPAEGAGIAGAALVSGVYDLAIANPKAISTAYFGGDASLYSERSTIRGLTETNLPLLIAVAENDPAHFQQQSLRVISAAFEKKRQLPRFLQMPGHNHITGVLHLGLADDRLGPELLSFIGRSRAVLQHSS